MPNSTTSITRNLGAKQMLNKVPQITAVFWVIKILTTGMGEALADYFDHAFEPLVVVALSGLALAAALWIQLRAERFIAWRYWSAVSLVSVFGTLGADAVHVILGVPYWVSSIGFLVGILATFSWWQFVEGSISIGTITTTRRELFYWAIVLGTFALGTAAGDMTAMNFKWGFLASGIIFSVAFALPLMFDLVLRKRINEAVSQASERGGVFAFWAAYVITRPLGASYADWLALPGERGGLGWGTLPVSVAMITAIVLFVALNRRSAKV